MTDDQIVSIVKDVDSFLIKEIQDFKITAIDLSAIINSRLRVMNASEESEGDFDDLLAVSYTHLTLPTNREV